MTNSLAFPAMFDVARNKVGVIEDKISVVNRCRLLFLSEPTELYNNPDFGVGLKRYLWQYNTENTKAMMKDRIVSQLSLHEPSCVSDKTSFADGLLFANDDLVEQDFNTLKMTVGLQTVFGDNVNLSIDLDSERDKMFGTDYSNAVMK